MDKQLGNTGHYARADAKQHFSFFLLLAECKWRLAFTVVRREFRVTMVSFCSATYPYGLFFSHIIFTRGELFHCSDVLRWNIELFQGCSNWHSYFWSFSFIRRVYRKPVLQCNTEHSPKPLSGTSSLKKWSKNQVPELLLAALGGMSTWTSALQSFSLVLVHPDGAWSFAITENKTLGMELWQIPNFSTLQCPQIYLKLIVLAHIFA